MLDTPTAERVDIDGVPHYRYGPSKRYPDGLVLPVIAGGSPELDDPPRADPADPPRGDPAVDDRPLGEGGKAALDAERAKAAAAEKRARAAEKALKAREDADLTEAERLKKEAEEGRALAATATAKLCKANLLAELSKPEHGIADARAATALAMSDRLVEFDDDDEPKDIADAVKQLVEAYPVLKGKAGRKAPNTDPGGGGGGRETPQLTADELAYAKAFDMTPEEYAAHKATPGAVPMKDSRRPAAAAA